MQAFYRLIRKTKTFLFKISMEDKLLFLEAFFLTGIMRKFSGMTLTPQDMTLETIFIKKL